MKKEMKSMPGSRKMTALAAILTAAVMLTACGSKEYLKDIKASDYVTLGNYMGVEAEAAEPTVPDGMVDAYIEYYLLPAYTTSEPVTGRAVEEGDTANIDYVGYIDGEAFAGGTDSNHDLTIGSHSFIDGFEDGLIGVNVGETVSLELAFPNPYNPNPDLSGVPVVFDVTVNSISIQKVPELNDELVQSMGIEGCTTEKELRDYLYNLFYDDAVQTYENSIETTLTDTIMSVCTFKEPPAEMVERFAKNIEDVMNAQAGVQGMTLTSYMQYYYGMDEATYKAQFQADALTGAQQYIMFQAIADIEGLNPSDEQLQGEINSRVETYGYESEEAYRESVDVEMLREQLMRQNVMEFLKENGNILTTSTVVD